MTEIRRLYSGDAALVLAAPELFDDPPTVAWTRDFFAKEGHHLIGAIEQDRLVGFVTGTEVVHPDKGPGMFLNELSVGEPYRRRGLGRRLTEALAGLARERGAVEMWVATEPGNAAARATYEATGAGPAETFVMYEWLLGD